MKKEENKNIEEYTDLEIKQAKLNTRLLIRIYFEKDVTYRKTMEIAEKCIDEELKRRGVLNERSR